MVGDVEQEEDCVVFALANAGSGASVITLSVGAGVVCVPVELSGITDNDPSTPVGGSWSGAGTASFGIRNISSAPLLRTTCFWWVGDIRSEEAIASYGVNPFCSSRFLDGHQLQSGQ